LDMDTERVQELLDAGANLGTMPFYDAAAGADELEQEVIEADQAIQDMNADLGIVNTSMVLQLAEQVGALGDQAEGMAQEMNEAAISVGQLATQTGIAEPEMVSLINEISNATFPNDEAMMYVQALNQMGVASENFGKSATDMDKINDAFGLGAQTVTGLSNELSVLGVDMNNVSSAFNALAYANANTVGGMQNYYNFIKKYDADFKQLGLDVDQASVIIAQATHKFGAGKAAYKGLSDAMKEADGDTRKLEQALGLQAGTLDNASQITGQYEGQLQALANEEMEHKTILDQLGAAWEDISLSVSQFLTPFMSVIGLIGSIGSFGLQVSGLRQLVQLTRSLTEIEIIDTAVKSAKAAVLSVVTVATTAYAAIVGVLSGEIGIVTAATMVWNAVLAMNPVMLVVLALVALVAVIYEVGKAFGWWSNVQGMLEAITSGLGRLWAAFINHPDVQAVLTAIGAAWKVVSDAIGWAWNALLEFFGIATGGDFDIVHTLIMAIGTAWEIISMPLRIVINLVQSIINVFNQFRTGQADLPSFIIQILTLMWNAYTTILSQIAQLVLRFGSQLLNYGIRAGRNFVNGVIQWVSRLPSRVSSRIRAVVSVIISGIQAWIAAGVKKATDFVTQVVGIFTGIPGKIASALKGVVNAITAPFQQAWNAVKPYVDNIKNALNSIPGIALGGETAPAYGGETTRDLITGNNFNTTTGEYIVREEKTVNLNLNLENVPAHIDTNTLIKMLTSKEVIDNFVGSSQFQDKDLEVKTNINSRNKRARGA